MTSWFPPLQVESPDTVHLERLHFRAWCMRKWFWHQRWQVKMFSIALSHCLIYSHFVQQRFIKMLEKSKLLPQKVTWLVMRSNTCFLCLNDFLFWMWQPGQGGGVTAVIILGRWLQYQSWQLWKRVLCITMLTSFYAGHILRIRSPTGREQPTHPNVSHSVIRRGVCDCAGPNLFFSITMHQWLTPYTSLLSAPD